jgi:hypothetical protein
MGVYGDLFSSWFTASTKSTSTTRRLVRPLTNRMSKCALRLLFSQRRWPAAYMSRDSGQGAVRDRSLQDLEGLDWGEANFDSHLVKFPRSQSPGYFAMRSTGGWRWPAISCRLSGERQIGREDRRKIDMMFVEPLGSEPCLRNCDEPGGNRALDVAEQFSTFVCGHLSNSSWLKRC